MQDSSKYLLRLLAANLKPPLRVPDKGVGANIRSFMITRPVKIRDNIERGALLVISALRLVLCHAI